MNSSMVISAVSWVKHPDMADERRPRFKTFQLYGRTPRWAVIIAASILFTLGWVGWGMVSRSIALKSIPRVDFEDENGVITQETTYTCAPAAMAMYFRDAGVTTSQYEIALLAGTDMSGTTDKGIRRAAAHFGYDTQIEKLTFSQIFALKIPVILKERFGGSVHVTYVRPFDNTHVRGLEILDPIDGYLLLDETGFYEYFGKPGSAKRCFIFTRTMGSG